MREGGDISDGVGDMSDAGCGCLSGMTDAGVDGTAAAITSCRVRWAA